MTDEDRDLEAALEDIRQTAHQRAGRDYPAGIDRILESHFQRVVSSRQEPHSPGSFRGKIDAVREAAQLSAERIPLDSQRRGGAIVHRAFARLSRRQTEGMMRQLREYTARSVEALESIAVALERLDDLERRIERLEATVAERPADAG